jgi:flagellar basal-body rod protein FlgF
VQGTGWAEAYTRAGDLRVDPSGSCAMAPAMRCSATAGRLTVPPTLAVSGRRDGTVSIVPPGQGPETRATVGRIKLVNPPATR